MSTPEPPSGKEPPTSVAPETRLSDGSPKATNLGAVFNTLRAGAERQPDPPPSSSVGKRNWVDIVAEYGVVAFLLVLVVGFSLWLPHTFPTWGNAKSILADDSIPGILALAAIIPLAAGEFDLSVGANLGFASIFSAYASAHGISVPIVLVLTLLIGCAVGVINTFLVIVVGVNAFVATLGTATILSGFNLLVTKGAVIYNGIPQSLVHISQNHVLGLPLTVYYFAACALILWYALDHTPFGRYLRATGMGRESARLSGVATSRFLASSFIIAGGIAAFAGLLETGLVGSATPTIGPDFLLPAYAAAFLGATTIRRGMFNVWGTVVGVFVLAIGITGLTEGGAPFWVANIFNGTALILAVSAAAVVDRRRVRRS